MQDFVVRLGTLFPQHEIGTQAATENTHQKGGDSGGWGNNCTENSRNSYSKGCYAEAIANTEEIDEILPADSTDGKGNNEQNPKIRHN